MMLLNRFFRIELRVTPMAVRIFTNQEKVSIEKAKALLGYEPRVDFDEGMKHVEKWLRRESYIEGFENSFIESSL